MSMAAALSNAFGGFERHRARYESERVENGANAEEISPSPAPDERLAEADAGRERSRVSETEGGDEEEGGVAADVEEDTPQETGDTFIDDRARYTASATVSLADLEEERELARRRTSACVLLAVCVLVRLWVLSIQDGDFGLLLLCLVGTSWTARWIRHNREREEELDRRISNYLDNSEPGTTEVDRNDMRMLSFQAQLALAIMESQRQMMQGGYGNPDGHANSTPGVSEEARGRWDRFQHKEASGAEKAAAKKGGYGSVSDNEKKAVFEEVPHCSICLGEYEEGEELVKLTCNHVYHDECISSWTSNHVKCPLCNFDLESVPADTAEEEAVPNSF
jgi:hypothetical protein